MDNNTRDMQPDDLRSHGREVADWVAQFIESVEELPVLPAVQPGDVSDALPASPPVAGEAMEEILKDFREIIVPATTQWNHPGFHAWFANTGSGPGILAETLTAALNNNAMVWRSGPASTELEGRVCDWLRQMLGLPDRFFGHIEDTASLSTITALVAARHRATGGEVREKGVHALPPMRVYCSEDAHSSIERAAILIGLGQEGCRQVETDDQHRLRPDALQRSIAEDRQAGITPIAIVATAGTTSTSSVDPVAQIADIAEREKIWLHVDAAYGGSMAVSEKFRWVLDGAGRADSIVINPHKWLFVPMDCSILYCADTASMRESLSLVRSYLLTPEDSVARHLMDYGPALGRRFRALKLWFVFRWFGHTGLAALIEHHVRLARDFAAVVDAEPEWEVLAPHPMSLVLFRFHPAGVEAEDELAALNTRILDRVNAAGRSFLSSNEVPGAGVKPLALRCAIGNSRTEQRHMDSLWEDLKAAAGAERPAS